MAEPITWWIEHPAAHGPERAISRPPTALQQKLLDTMESEWESCQEIADRAGESYSNVYARLKACWRRRLVDRACIGYRHWPERVLWRRVDTDLIAFIASELDGIGDELVPLYGAVQPYPSSPEARLPAEEHTRG